MKNDYNIDRIIDNFYSKGYTKFLNPKEFLLVKNKLPKRTQNIYKPYNEAVKVIIYKKEIPNIIICKITFNCEVKHTMVLKGLFNLGLKEDTFGDIIIMDNIAYIYLLEELYDYVKYNYELNKVSINSIDKIDKDYLKAYEPKFEKIELLVSSLRIDNVISSITNDSRKSIISRFKDNHILLNYDIVKKNDIYLKDGDVFSIRRIGKFRYNGIIKNTKKGGFIISIYKYI